MKALHLYIGTGVLVFLLSLGFSLPASLLYQWQRSHIDPSIQVYVPQGTLWHGTAEQVGFSGIRLNAVEWHFRPLSLLLGRISFRIHGQSDAGAVSVVMAKGFGVMRLNDLQGALPVNQLVQALKLPIPPLSGRLDASFSDLRIIDTGVEFVEGKVNLSDVAWPLSSPPIALGSYRAEFKTERDKVNVSLSDTASQIELKGKAEITPTGTFLLDAQLRPRAAAPAGAVNLIQQLGNPDSEGWYRLHRQGTF